MFGQSFVAFLTGKGQETPIKPQAGTDEIHGLELFATVAAVVAVGDQSRNRRTITFLGNNAVAGPVVKASARAPAVCALIGSFWRTMARVGATCRIEQAPSAANPADAPSRRKKLPSKPDVEGELGSSQRAL